MLKRIFSILAVTLFCVDALAGEKYNSRLGVKTNCPTFRNVSGSVVSDKCESIYVPNGTLSESGDHFVLMTGLTPGGATSMTSTETVVSTAYSLIQKYIYTDPTYYDGTLANGTPGQILTIEIVFAEPSGVFYVTPAKKTGFTRLVFDVEKDLATLLYVNDSVGWIIIGLSNVDIEF